MTMSVHLHMGLFELDMKIEVVLVASGRRRWVGGLVRDMTWKWKGSGQSGIKEPSAGGRLQSSRSNTRGHSRPWNGLKS